MCTQSKFSEEPNLKIEFAILIIYPYPISGKPKSYITIMVTLIKIFVYQNTLLQLWCGKTIDTYAISSTLEVRKIRRARASTCIPT